MGRLLAGAGLAVGVAVLAWAWIGPETPTSPTPVHPAANHAEPEASEPAGDAALSFNRDIRPILSEKCFACHGPDAAVSDKLGGFRLDTRATAIVPAQSGDTPIVPGDADASAVIARITHDKPNLVMPPPEAKIEVTEDEVALLRRWINEGAEYEGHWAYQRPLKRPLPETRFGDWVRNDIDRFIAARLDAAGLAPSPEADRATLIRRLSLDLTGLPPTPAEIDAFVNDPSPDAYEKLVDRLLASPHFGERLALPWLDAARYADTIGYQLDHYKSAWPYRDYVIKSFNENKPYDRFVVEQLAGDLLPDATDETRLATAFCRMHMMNHEGGSIDEEFRVTAVADRIETVATVFMAQTYNCAMCHDHKYDPTTQQDYYNLFKYFHSIDERGVHSNKPERAVAYAPRMDWYPEALKAELAEARASLDAAEGARAAAVPDIAAEQSAWERSLRETHGVRWAKAELTDAQTTQKSGAFDYKPDGSVLLSNRDSPRHEDLTLTYRTDATGLRLIKLDALPDPWNGGQIGRSGSGDAQPTHIKITAQSIQDPTKTQRVALRWAWATQSNKGRGPNKNKVLGPQNLLEAGRPGWSTGGGSNKSPQVLLLVADQPFGFEGGSRIEVFIEHRSGLPRRTLGRVRLGFAAAAASVVEVFPGADQAQADRDPQAEADAEAGDDQAGGEPAVELVPLALIDPDRRTAHGSKTFAEQWRRQHSERYAALSDEVAKAEQAVERVKQKATPVSIMKELDEPKPMFVLERGAYDKPIEDRPAKLELPSFIDLPLPEGSPNNRLGFARWLVRDDHPLTARVRVNQIWQMLLGTGIVATTEDFGSQADWPSHPALLDHLAVRFVDSGWDQKALIKRIVTSATYRQRATRQADSLQIDPDNRLLSSYPRQRLPGELIRDQALAASGLLVETIGGPSVKPYQPPGLWREVSMSARSNTHVFKRDDGEKLYRRSLYTFIKRKAPPPQLATFGAPNREACVVQRGDTNTPLQMLVLWNDEQLLEAARVLAQRTLAEAEEDAGDDAKLSRMMRRCTGHAADGAALGVLRDALDYYRQRYRDAPDDAAALLKQGEHPLPEDHDPAELAAWMMVGNALLSLDETIVKD